MNRLILLAAALTLGLPSCKTSDPEPEPDLLQCPSDPTPLRGFGGRGSMIMPNAFSPNGDGRNDRFRLVCSDTGVIRSMSVRIVDSKGNVVGTLRSQTESWDGYDMGMGMGLCPAGYYRVDYGIDLHGGTGEDVVLNGHTCLKLYLSDSGKTCINPVGDPNGNVFEDQIDPKASTYPYATAEKYCQ